MAIESVDRRHRLFAKLLLIKLYPLARNLIRLDGVAGTGQPRRGVLALGSKGLREPLDQVLAELVQHSGRRVAVR